MILILLSEGPVARRHLRLGDLCPSPAEKPPEHPVSEGHRHSARHPFVQELVHLLPLVRAALVVARDVRAAQNQGDGERHEAVEFQPKNGRQEEHAPHERCDVEHGPEEPAVELVRLPPGGAFEHPLGLAGLQVYLVPKSQADQQPASNILHRPEVRGVQQEADYGDHQWFRAELGPDYVRRHRQPLEQHVEEARGGVRGLRELQRRREGAGLVRSGRRGLGRATSDRRTGIPLLLGILDHVAQHAVRLVRRGRRGNGRDRDVLPHRRVHRLGELQLPAHDKRL
mmetsp:Transcript_13484/g.30711  ORF Transcript_13484/g.30711 Transcript_13484/m.30711 type:complete len:284 (+) Transcript_13484:95-946(+)